MKNMFHGTIHDLKALVEKTRIPGDWISDGSKHTFRSCDGGVLNWWASTKTIQFQGKRLAKRVLELSLLHVQKLAMTIRPVYTLIEKKTKGDEDVTPWGGLM